MEKLMNQVKQTSNSTWPYSSLLLFGYFGKQAPGGRTLAVRNTIALVIFFVGVYLITITQNPLFKLALITTSPLAVVIIMWAYKEYLAGLDELSRRIQYEAFAFSYGAAIAIALTLFTASIYLETLLLPLWVIVAEALRGVALVFIARKYA